MFSPPMPSISSSVTEIVSSVCLRQVDAGRLELLVEGDVGAADDDGEDHVRLGQLDLVDHRVELGVAERVVLLADDLAPLSTFSMCLRAILFEVRGQM